MKTLNFTLAILFLFVSSMYAGDKETIIEKIEKATTIPVFFPKAMVDVRQPQVQSAQAQGTPLYPNEIEAFKKPMRGVDLPVEYNYVHELIVSEMNKVFSTDKFVVGKIEDVPTRESKILGIDVILEDWVKIEEKFIVVCYMEGLYSSFSYERNKKKKLQIKTKYTVGINAKFCNIVEKEQPLKFLNPIGVMTGVGNETFIQDGYYTSIEQFTAMIAPESLVEQLGTVIPGSFDGFYEKQKKKYDKAMKKKK